EPVVGGGTTIEQGTGLAALARAGEVGVMRAMVVGIQASAPSREQGLEPASDRQIRRLVEQPPRNAGLIGDHDRRDAGAVESSDGCGGTRQQSYRIGVGDVTGVFDDGAVAV